MTPAGVGSLKFSQHHSPAEKAIEVMLYIGEPLQHPAHSHADRAMGGMLQTWSPRLHRLMFPVESATAAMPGPM